MHSLSANRGSSIPVIHPLKLLPQLWRRFNGSGFSASRRRVLMTTTGLAATLAAGLSGWGWWRRRESRQDIATAEVILEALCDRLLPAWGEHPGVKTLGIDRQISVDFLDQHSAAHDLIGSLRQARFISLDDHDKDALVRQLMTADDQPRTSRALRLLLHRLVRTYYAHPDAWPALGYQQPQPRGFPDYATCDMERAA